MPETIEELMLRLESIKNSSPADVAARAMALFGQTGPPSHAERPDMSDIPGRYSPRIEIGDLTIGGHRGVKDSGGPSPFNAEKFDLLERFSPESLRRHLGQNPAEEEEALSGLDGSLPLPYKQGDSLGLRRRDPKTLRSRRLLDALRYPSGKNPTSVIPGKEFQYPAPKQDSPIRRVGRALYDAGDWFFNSSVPAPVRLKLELRKPIIEDRPDPQIQRDLGRLQWLRRRMKDAGGSFPLNDEERDILERFEPESLIRHPGQTLAKTAAMRTAEMRTATTPPATKKRSGMFGVPGPPLPTDSEQIPTDVAEQAMALSGPTGSLAHAGRPDMPDVPARYSPTIAKKEESDEDRRKRRISNLNMMRGIASGAGRIGDALVEYGDRMARRPLRQQGNYTEGIDNAIAEEEDKMPQSLIEKLRAAGYQIPDDIKFSQFKSVAPALASAMNAESMREYRAGRAAESQAVQDRFEDREKRLGIDQTDRRSRERASIGDAFDRDVIVKTARTQINAAKAALAGLEAGDMGAFAASIKAAKASGEMGPLSEPDKAPFQQRQAYWQIVYDWAVRRGVGSMSEGTKMELRKTLASYIRSAESAMRERAATWSNRHEGRMGLSQSEIQNDVIGVPDNQIKVRTSNGEERFLLREDLEEALGLDPGIQVIEE